MPSKTSKKKPSALPIIPKELIDQIVDGPMLGHSTLWVHGHTHDTFDYVVNGTRVVCNPRGYCGEGHQPENAQFNPGFVVALA